MSGMQKELRARHRSVLAVLILQSLVAIGLYLVGAWRNHSSEYWYLVWNLFLAWVPLGLAYVLFRYLKKNPWFSWQGVLLTLVWLGFLPNSFYMISDFIHLGSQPRIDLVFDTIMFAAFAISGLTLGFTSLFLIHKQLLKRMALNRAHLIIAFVLLACGFAIYIGRDFRWNTWDILINPAGLLFDVTDPILDPAARPEAFSTAFGFFALLGSIYLVIWRFVGFIASSEQS